LTGRFDVLEIVRDASGAVTQLAVNWEQHCNGIVPALLGQIRYNSDVPVIKTPRSRVENPLNARGCVEASNPNGAVVSMNANNTTDSAGGRSLQFSWSSTTGDAGPTPRSVQRALDDGSCESGNRHFVRHRSDQQH